MRITQVITSMERRGNGGWRYTTADGGSERTEPTSRATSVLDNVRPGCTVEILGRVSGKVTDLWQVANHPVTGVGCPGWHCRDHAGPEPMPNEYPPHAHLTVPRHRGESS